MPGKQTCAVRNTRSRGRKSASSAKSADKTPAEGGHRTAYLWEQVWARESWLEILGRYLIAQRDKKKQIERIIFPRFHQLDVTRKLQRAGAGEGDGLHG